MLPLKLTMKNFLSFANPPTFDFTQFSMACFSGINGIGKSAIVDAITWALWGEVSKKIAGAGNSRIEPELLRDDTTEMSVELEFLENGEKYKVIRTFYAGTKNKSLLNIFKMSDSAYQCISSDPPMISTDLKILAEHLLVDYHTFTNTAFIRQGNSDEFTSKTPSQRKDVLLPLIVPPEYTKLHEGANIERRRIMSETDKIDSAVIDIQDSLSVLSNIWCPQDPALSKKDMRRVWLDSQYDFSESKSLLDTQMDVLKSNVALTETALQNSKKLLQETQTELSQLLVTQEKVSGLLQTQASLSNTHGGLVSKLKEAQHTLSTIQASNTSMEDLRAFVQQHTKAVHDQERLTTKESQMTHHAEAIESTRLTLEDRKTLLAEKVQSLQGQVDETATLLKQGDEIQQKYRELTQAREGVRSATDKGDVLTTRLTPLKKSKEGLERTINTFDKELTQHKDNLHRLFAQAECTESLEVVEDSIQETAEAILSNTKKLEWMQDVVTDLKRQEKEYHTITGDIARLSERRNAISSELSRQEMLLDNIESGEITACQECGSVLSGDAYRNKLQAYITDLTDKIADIADDERGLRERRKSLECMDKLQQAQADVVQYAQAYDTFTQKHEKLTHIHKEIVRERHEYQASRVERDIFEQRVHEIELQIQGIEQDITEQATLKNTAQSLVNTHVKYETLYDQVQAAQERIAEYQNRLGRAQSQYGAHCVSMQDHPDIASHEIALVALRAETSSIMERYGDESVSQCITRLSPYVQSLRVAEQNIEQKSALLQSIESLTIRQKEIETRLTSTKTEIDAIDFNEVSITNNKCIIETASEQITKEEQQLQQSHKEMASLQVTLQQYESHQEKLQALYAQKEKLTKDLYLLDILRTATGREGIPSALIQTTIENIEEETNNIISLFDPNMLIRFETEKVTKSTKQARGTLDIKIVTGSHERFYEMYSGGQKYRIDFAIRIAMSKVLSLQAGSPLELLVIDEGFGTQDMAGLESIVQVINKLQFPKIIIITHIDTLRNALPSNVHFFQEDGSTTFTIA